MKSLTIVFPEKQKVEIIEEIVEMPGPNDLLCVARKSLISMGTEWSCFLGEFDKGTNWEQWVRYPFFPGYSMAADVLEVGNKVDKYKKGDRIVAPVSHRQFFRVAASQAQHIPQGLSYEEASWSSLANTTQLGVRRAKIRLGERVCVVGLGMLGQLVTQYLSLLGARYILAIDPIPFRLETAKAHGADEILPMNVEQAYQEVMRLTKEHKLDVIFEITGNSSVLSACIPLLRKFGRLVLLGDSSTPTSQYLGPGVVSNSLSILGIHGSMVPEYKSELSPWTASEMTQLFFDFLVQGRMRVSDLITDFFSPIDATELYPHLGKCSPDMIGVVFDWDRVKMISA
jgi:threonine dehydrogenase-like Zn-dependent dehydrogenase